MQALVCPFCDAAIDPILVTPFTVRVPNGTVEMAQKVVAQCPKCKLWMPEPTNGGTTRVEKIEPD
ncbi:MAG TPA: hypothetical protein VKS79_14940 [Gemmataceae bacterium]|nr:hypothetical protein [Gemmataceae bacterium]